MHGLFGWISAQNHRALVAFIARHLESGGLLYVSYDCMPGWAAVAPLRSIMARHFAPRPGMSSQTALQRALAYLDDSRAELVRDESKLTYSAGLIQTFRDYVDLLCSQNRTLDALEIAESIQQDVAAVGCERARDAETDAARRAGDQRDFVGEVHDEEA